jgi:hypothetical protein
MTKREGMFGVYTGQMDNGLFYVIVKDNGVIVFERPGFRSAKEAGEFGFAWAREHFEITDITLDNRDEYE